MMVKLPCYMSWLVITVPLVAGPLAAQIAHLPRTDSSAAQQAELVVLQNGEILQGRAVPAGDRVLITLPGREISLRPSEIDVVARTLDDAYLLKRAKVRPTDVGGRLDLATWCLRHNLLESAGQELAAAAQVQPFEPRLKAIQRRLDQARQRQETAVRASYNQVAPSVAPTATKPTTSPASKNSAQDDDRSNMVRVWPPVAAYQSPVVKPANKATGLNPQNRADTVGAETPAALDRFVRSLPARAVEEFTAGVHPMITRSCAAAGCHAPGNETEFTLLRLPRSTAASRRLTQRNLYNTVQLIDFDAPEESRLLKVASQPHGPLKAGVFGDERSPKYRQLAAWVSALTGASLNRDDVPTIDVPAAIAWDALQRSASGASAAEQARLDAVLNQLEPNRPAEIRPAPESPTTMRTSGAVRHDGGSNVRQQRFRD